LDLPIKRFADFVSAMAADWANSQNIQPILPEGDPLLAVFESTSSQLLFIQAQIQLVMALARAQTSSGADLDTFYGQFGFLRIGGVSASGQETFGAFVPAANQVVIPIATIVQSPGGGITYQVVADPTNPNYSSTLLGYVLASGQSTVSVTIQATSPGTAFNVAGGQLTQLATTLPGIDYVTNPSAISNGTANETDASYSLRFLLWLNSLSKAIATAIEAAILGVQTGLIYRICDQAAYVSGAIVINKPGQFVVIVDDGSGSPPSSLLTSIYNAVNAVTGFTIQATVIGVTDTTINVGMTIVTQADADHAADASTVQAALTTFLNGLSLNAYPTNASGQPSGVLTGNETATISLTRLAQVAYDATSDVVNVPTSSITINSVNADLTLSLPNIPRAGTITVS
jgi:hypothetical protein